MLRDVKTISKFKRVVDPKFFTLKAYRFLCKRIYNHYDANDGELLSQNVLLLNINKLIKDEDTKNLFRKKLLPIFKREVESPKGITKEIYEWAEKQQFGTMLEQAARVGSEGEIEKAKDLVKSSFLFDTSDDDFIVHSVFEEWKIRQRERKRSLLGKEFKQIKTGLGILDNYMSIRKNQSYLILIMGTSGVGKSIIAINFGIYALNAGCKVAHFVFENTAKQTLDRYDSRLVKYPYHYLSTYRWTKRDLAIANRIMRGFRRKRKNYLKIIHAPIDTASVPSCEGCLKELEIKEKWIPDVIIYDSGDHMLPSEKQDFYRLNVKKTYTDLKRQSEIRSIPIISTTHAKASARGSRVRQESFSEAYDKSRLADGVLTISQTQEQEDDRTAELYLDKWRDFEGKVGIFVELLFRVMTIRYISQITTEGESDASLASNDGQ